MSKLNVKAKAKETVETTSTVVKNAEQLVIAVALLVNSVAAYRYLDTVSNEVWRWTVTGSVVIVSLVAFYQLVRFLGRK